MQKFKTLAILTIATICSLPMMGQDLLARQAPIDRKMKAVDSVALQRLIFTENYESPAEDLYEDWMRTSTRTGATNMHTTKRRCPTLSVSH